jgi:hypothetical protein
MRANNHHNSTRPRQVESERRYSRLCDNFCQEVAALRELIVSKDDVIADLQR